MRRRSICFCILPVFLVLGRAELSLGQEQLRTELASGYEELSADCGNDVAENRALDDSGESYTELAQSLVLGVGLTDDVGAYLEWYAFFPHSADTAEDEHVLNGGFTYHWTNNLMLDIEAGIGLNDAAPDYFIGTGGAVRF